MRAVIAILAAASATASAEPAPEVIATQPFALVARGMEVSYERAAWSRLSWLAIAGARLGAAGDFDASTLVAGGELRWWPRSSTPMRGPYVGVHLSVGRTTLSDRMGELGASDGVTERVDVGWRWVIHHTVAITPSLGAGAIEDIDESGRLATVARPTVAFGLELGWWR